MTDPLWTNAILALLAVRKENPGELLKLHFLSVF